MSDTYHLKKVSCWYQFLLVTEWQLSSFSSQHALNQTKEDKAYTYYCPTIKFSLIDGEEERRGSTPSSWCNVGNRFFSSLSGMWCDSKTVQSVLKRFKNNTASGGGFTCGRTQSGQVFTFPSPVPQGPTLVLYFPQLSSQSFNKPVWLLPLKPILPCVSHPPRPFIRPLSNRLVLLPLQGVQTFVYDQSHLIWGQRKVLLYWFPSSFRKSSQFSFYLSTQRAVKKKTTTKKRVDFCFYFHLII